MTAYLFTITSLETGRQLGAALIAPQARYASIAWRGASRLARPFVTPENWREIEREVTDTITAGPLPMTSPFVRALGLEHDQVLQYLTIEAIGMDGEFVHADELDRRLKQAAVVPTLELTHE